MFLGSINSNDPVRIADLMTKSLAKWATLSREERLLPTDPKGQIAEIRRHERFYPEGGLVLLVTSRDMPREGQATQGDWRTVAWNHDFAWFTKSEAKQLLPSAAKVGSKHDLPGPMVQRIVCAHLVDHVRGQTTAFDDSHVKKARISAEVTALDGNVATLRLEGETRTEMGGQRPHGLDLRLLGNATYDVKQERFLTFEMVALGQRWGGTRYNGRRRDQDAAPIGFLFTLAEDTPCQRVAPAFTYHKSYRPFLEASR